LRPASPTVRHDRAKEELAADPEPAEIDAEIGRPALGAAVAAAAAAAAAAALPPPPPSPAPPPLPPPPSPVPPPPWPPPSWCSSSPPPAGAWSVIVSAAMGSEFPTRSLADHLTVAVDSSWNGAVYVRAVTLVVGSVPSTV